jgi:acid phosphatase (class A)
VNRSIGALICVIGLSALAGAASAQRQTDTPLVAAVRGMDPLTLLPPPYARGSPEEAAELLELHQIQNHRTPERLAQAQWDQDHQSWMMYQSTLGPAFDVARLPATAKLLSKIEHDNIVVDSAAKTAFHRMRPWAADPTLHGCVVKPSDDPMSSYPSGHTDVGYALGLTLADLMPDKAQVILARAKDYAFSRMVCGVHFRSDTVGGEALATGVTLVMLKSPELQADIAAARAELQAAGL